MGEEGRNAALDDGGGGGKPPGVLAVRAPRIYRSGWSGLVWSGLVLSGLACTFGWSVWSGFVWFSLPRSPHSQLALAPPRNVLAETSPTGGVAGLAGLWML